MPRRKSDSCAAILAAVSVAFPYTNNLLGMYMRRRTPTTEARMYKSPATLAFLLSEVMCPPTKMYQFIRAGPRESSGRLQCWLIVADNRRCTTVRFLFAFSPVNEAVSQAIVARRRQITSHPFCRERRDTLLRFLTSTSHSS